MLLRCLGVLALASTGCTLDYDALLEGAGGGEGTSTTADATTTTGGSTSATTTATTSSTTTTSTSSGDGGQGGGGQGGEGGAGGDGGSGGALPFSEPCAGLAITWTDDLGTSLGEAWRESSGNDVSPTTEPAAGMTFELEGAPGDEEVAAIETTSADALFECGVIIAVTTIDPPEPDEGDVEVALAAGEHGIEIIVARGDGSVSCTVRAGAIGSEDVDVVDCTGEAPERLLRVRHTGDALCFDMAPSDGAFEQVGACHPVEGGERVFVGASAETTASVTVGKVH